MLMCRKEIPGNVVSLLAEFNTSTEVNYDEGEELFNERCKNIDISSFINPAIPTTVVKGRCRGILIRVFFCETLPGRYVLVRRGYMWLKSGLIRRWFTYDEIERKLRISYTMPTSTRVSPDKFLPACRDCVKLRYRSEEKRIITEKKFLFTF